MNGLLGINPKRQQTRIFTIYYLRFNIYGFSIYCPILRSGLKTTVKK